MLEKDELDPRRGVRGRIESGHRSGANRLSLWLPAVLLLSSVVASCRGKSELADAAPPPSLHVKSAKESERAKDDLWRRAEEGDPVELAHLANREGALGLLDGLEEGGPIGLVALAALPFADDAEAAYQRLGEILRQLDPAEIGPVLHAVVDIARRPPAQT